MADERDFLAELLIIADAKDFREMSTFMRFLVYYRLIIYNHHHIPYTLYRFSPAERVSVGAQILDFV